MTTPRAQIHVLLAIFLVAGALALPATTTAVAQEAPEAPEAPEVPFACGQLYEDPAEDVDEENLDLIGGGIAAVDDTSFTAELKVRNLTNDVPFGASSVRWYFQWTHNETNYFANAAISFLTPDTVTYNLGTQSGTQYSNTGVTEGTFIEGEEGTILIVVPLEEVGSPAPEDLFTDTFAITFIGMGVGVTLLSEVDLAPDEGFGEDYAVGSCASARQGPRTSPGVRLRMSSLNPKRGNTITATASLAECSGLEGTEILLQRRNKNGVFRAIRTKALNDDCQAQFKIKANFKQARFRAMWPKQHDDYRGGKSPVRRVRTR